MQVSEHKENQTAAVLAYPAACESKGAGRKGYQGMHMHSVIGNRRLLPGTAYRMFTSGSTQYRKLSENRKAGIYGCGGGQAGADADSLAESDSRKRLQRTGEDGVYHSRCIYKERGFCMYSGDECQITE